MIYILEFNNYNDYKNIGIAPNGKKSNLTPKQWQQVRTPEFKKWFGDWENDLENSSKVVDENGEPMVVYHGTRRDFDTFDYKEIGTSTDDEGFLGYGFYFTNIESEARMYSFNGIVKSVFINIRNPYKHTLEDIEELRNNGIDFRDKVELNIDYDSLAEKLKSIDEFIYNFFIYLGKYGYSKGWELFLKEYDNETTRTYEINGLDLNDIADLYEATLDNYGQITDFDKERLIKLGIEPTTLKYKIDYDDHIPNLSEITKQGSMSQEVTKVIKKLGYDGVFLGEIVAFYPNQIKSATNNNGNFDSSKNSILESNNSNRADYLKWKRKNVSLRGMKELGNDNGAGDTLGRGLYTAALSNKSMSKQFGKVYFVVNGRPKKPIVFNTLNDWQIWFGNTLVKNVLIERGLYKGFPDRRYFSEVTSIEEEIPKLGYDGVEIKGREYVNYKPENVLYFETEEQVEDYYNSIFNI